MAERLDCPMPELRAPQRARVVYDFEEQGERIHGVETGWAQADGPWLHFLPDQSFHWMTWPATSIVTVEWVKATRRGEAAALGETGARDGGKS